MYIKNKYIKNRFRVLPFILSRLHFLPQNHQIKRQISEQNMYPKVYRLPKSSVSIIKLRNFISTKTIIVRIPSAMEGEIGEWKPFLNLSYGPIAVSTSHRIFLESFEINLKQNIY